MIFGWNKDGSSNKAPGSNSTDGSQNSKVWIMGVINVTPDSFSDGGSFHDPTAAIRHARQLLADGADILDIGAESTRPGATPLSESEEWLRLKPVLEGLRRELPQAVLSLDTRKSGLMLTGAALGVALINDVEGARDPATLKALAGFPGLSYLCMHMHQTPQTMQSQPLDGSGAVGVVTAFFDDRFKALRDAGFPPECIWMDPGFGFGKTDAGNACLMRAVPAFADRYNLAIGVSRKGFLGRTLSIKEPRDRDAASKTLEFGLACAGARMIRTHDVARLKKLLDLAHA